MRGGLVTGSRPTPPGITLDTGSEVPASHRLMEAVGQQAAAARARTEQRTAAVRAVAPGAQRI